LASLDLEPPAHRPLAASLLGLAGCGSDPREPDAATRLRAAFPEQAAEILDRSEALQAFDAGFAVPSRGAGPRRRAPRRPSKPSF